MSETLRIRNLTKRFGVLAALDDVSFGVGAGEVVAVIGPNGAGKTTLLNMVSGLDVPDEGHVELDAGSLDGRPSWQIARAGLGRTQQAPGLFDSLSVLDNLAIAVPTGQRPPNVLASALRLRSARGFAEEARERAIGIAARLGLEDEIDRPAGELPFGKQRVVEIGRALSSQPRVLLLDEPAAGLGGHEIHELAALLRDLPDPSTSVVIVEHNMQLVMAIAERIVVLNFGQVLFEGTPEEVRSHPEVVEAYLGSTTEGDGTDARA